MAKKSPKPFYIKNVSISDIDNGYQSGDGVGGGASLGGNFGMANLELANSNNIVPNKGNLFLKI